MSNRSKADVEVATARTRLDATLQHLVDRRDDSQQSSEGECSMLLPESLILPHFEGLSSPVQTPRKSGSVSKSSRKRKRKDDSNATETGNYHHTYVMKLFDRSVDLAQFDEDTPLYPICRAWMRNQPHNRNLAPRPRSPSPEPDVPNYSDDDSLDKATDVYRLPSPLKKEAPMDLRIPMVVASTNSHLDMNADASTAPAPENLLLGHMVRWKQIRETWRKSSHQDDMRFSSGLDVLKNMFDRQCKDS